MTGFVPLLAVAVGGSLGALSRFGLDAGFGGDTLDSRHLIVILLINTLGATALGVVRRPQGIRVPAWLAEGFTVGFLGSFTTWSVVMVVFAMSTSQGIWWLGAGYLVATLASGLLGAWWGRYRAPGPTIGLTTTQRSTL